MLPKKVHSTLAPHRFIFMWIEKSHNIIAVFASSSVPWIRKQSHTVALWAVCSRHSMSLRLPGAHPWLFTLAFTIRSLQPVPRSQSLNLSVIGKEGHKQLLLKLRTIYPVFLGSNPIWSITNSFQNNQTSSNKIWLCVSRCVFFLLLVFLGDFGRFL